MKAYDLIIIGGGPAGLAAGMDAHISKPLDAEKLIQVISDICKKRKEHAKGDADI